STSDCLMGLPLTVARVLSAASAGCSMPRARMAARLLRLSEVFIVFPLGWGCGGWSVVGRAGLDAQGMDALRHEIGQHLIDHAVAHDLRFAAELGADDMQREMPTAGIAGMACMQRTVVADIEVGRL